MNPSPDEYFVLIFLNSEINKAHSAKSRHIHFRTPNKFHRVYTNSHGILLVHVRFFVIISVYLSIYLPLSLSVYLTIHLSSYVFIFYLYVIFVYSLNSFFVYLCYNFCLHIFKIKVFINLFIYLRIIYLRTLSVFKDCRII